MINRENYIPPSRFHSVITLKFLFTIIAIIFLFIIYFTFDENVFSGLALIDERNEEAYMVARTVLLVGLVFFSALIICDLVIQILGFTFNFNRNNIISMHRYNLN